MQLAKAGIAPSEARHAVSIEEVLNDDRTNAADFPKAATGLGR